MKKKFYLTTPLYYVNARPHIGHSYTTIAADVLARFKRLCGYEVLFLTGTDEHGQKVQKTALESGKTPEQFTDELSGSFRELWQQLGIEYSDFIRTTEPRHLEAVKSVWLELDKKGLIYKQQYEGWYCTPCEAFWPSRELAPGAAKTCPQCQRPLEAIQEENYFFAISRYQEWLIGYFRDYPDSILPESRYNETLSFLEKNTLMDLCISRPRARLEWGIACPLSKDHVTYVWFDALINYVSALGFPDRGGKLDAFWPCDVHLIGKDILRPHTIYWPIMLKALELGPPKKVFAHGWWVQDKAKMSKSLGNVVDPLAVIGEFGIDCYRYFLLREVPFGQDGTYSRDAILGRYNTDLANDLGNLLFRTLSMLEKYFDGQIPEGAATAQNSLRESVRGLPARMEEALDRLKFHEALGEIWSLVTEANRFIEEKAPWKLAREKKDRELGEVMASLAEVLRIVARAVWPFMPKTAEKMWTQLGLAPSALVQDSFMSIEWNYIVPGTKTLKGATLFPKKDESLE